MNTAPLETLRTFRCGLYQLFDCLQDALFELIDALLTARAVSSPAHLSLAPVFQRGWGSLYGALAAGRMCPEAVETLLAAHSLVAGEPIFAVDVST